MPVFACPNCSHNVRVAPVQIGRALRCPHCRGRFIADRDLPANLLVQDYATAPESPPIQNPAPPAAWEFSEDDPIPQPPVAFAGELDFPSAWFLFWVVMGLEVGFWGWGWLFYARPEWLWDRPLEIRRLYVIALYIHLILRNALIIMAMFQTAKISRDYKDGVIAWCILETFFGAAFFGIYLVSRSVHLRHVSGR